MICALCLVPAIVLETAWRPLRPPGNRLVQMGVMVVLDGTGDEKYLPVFIMSQSHPLSVPCALCCCVCGTRSYARTARTAPRLSLDRHRLQPRRGDRPCARTGVSHPAITEAHGANAYLNWRKPAPTTGALRP